MSALETFEVTYLKETIKFGKKNAELPTLL